ncbi:cora-domain-containing protein [Mucor ambiguus]|uniref:Cora-domain-containing protein n=1 Tax=Mucor ambiguus TaxID=91626 RepID=A0A0C9MP93_9FUNG|nr:cora-domain-containing protein [Mucor ambiguus]
MSNTLYTPLSKNDYIEEADEEEGFLVAIVDNDLVTSSNYGSSNSSSNSNTLENDVWFPSEQPSYPVENKGVHTSDELIDMEAVEELILNSCLHTKRPGLHNTTTTKKRKQKKMQPRISQTTTYGAINGEGFIASPSGRPEFRYAFYSSALTSTIHTKDFAAILPAIKDHHADACFWIDIHNPSDVEMKQIQRIFHIHPLTAEDITTEEPREKCEALNDYYFICFRTFESDATSPNYLQPIGIYILIFQGFILSFHFGAFTPHSANVRKRMMHLKDCLTVTPDWICYGLLDDIIDTFVPLIRAIEFEVDSIDELVLILKESEQSDMLRRIGYCRKKMMSLLRLLVAKSDVIKTLIKRGDHVVAMLQSLNHYEKISSRSHSNYLAQISIEMTQTNNEINDVLSKLTALGSVLVPMNLVTGMWGMNVKVPGQFQDDKVHFAYTSHYIGY